MSTIDWLADKGKTFVQHVNDERGRLVKWGDPDDVAELSHMACKVAADLWLAGSMAMDASDRLRDTRTWPHIEELYAEMRGGEHGDDDV